MMPNERRSFFEMGLEKEGSWPRLRPAAIKAESLVNFLRFIFGMEVLMVLVLLEI
jgi:hypothetical protein